MLITHGLAVGLGCAVVAIVAFPDDARKCSLLAAAIVVIVATSTLTIHLVWP